MPEFLTRLGPARMAGRSTEELLRQMRHIEEHADNKPAERGIYLYKMDAHKRLDAIAKQITHNMSEARTKAGSPAQCDGYSGRKQKRRR